MFGSLGCVAAALTFFGAERAGLVLHCVRAQARRQHRDQRPVLGLHREGRGGRKRAETLQWIRSHCISFTFAGDEFLPNPDFQFPPQSEG